MDIGSIRNMTNAYQYTNQIANRQVSSTTFQSMLSDAASADKTGIADQSFEEMWKSRYPGAKYHVMDASAISQGTWERNDFPAERFFEDEVDVENDIVKTTRNYHCLHDNQRIMDDGVIEFVYLSTTVYEDNRPQGETAEIEDFSKQDITLTKDGGNNVEIISVEKAYYVPEEYAERIANHYLSFASDEELMLGSG